MTDYFDLHMPRDQLLGLSSLGLAHLGDGVFELMVRSWLCLHGKAKAKDGVITLGGRDYQLFQPETAYLAFFLTVVITAVLLLAPLALGTAMAYYGIWAMAAWLFILAVYFTSKLM